MQRLFCKYLGIALVVAGCATPKTEPANQCPSGLVTCSGACVDTTTDVGNCGACGKTCQSGQECRDSACQCLGALTACSGSCVSVISDPAHCGTCAKACTSGQVCDRGACGTTCSAGLTACSGGCVALNGSDPLNCGACGKTCPAGQACTNGSCGCATAGQSLCGSNCVDTMTSAANCGSCGKVCAATQVCTGGACGCPSGQMACPNGSCAPTGQCGGTGGAGGATGTGGAGGAGGTTGAGGGAGARACAPASVDVISDFEEGNGSMIKQGTPQRTGWWYVYADPSAGTQTPALSSGPVTVEASGDTAMCNKWALHSTATNHPMYVGFGGTFLPVAPPSTSKNPYDLSAWDGISFRIKSGGGTQPAVYFELLTRESQPSMYGGVATVATVDQNNNRGQMLTNITTSYQTVYVPFGGLIPRWMPAPGTGQACPAAGAGVPKCQAPKFVPASTLGFQFSMYPDPGFPLPGGSTLGTYNLWVDDVTLYKRSATVVDLPAPPSGGGSKPFPRNLAVGSCGKPTGADGKFMVSAYNQWKSRFVVAAGGGMRVQRPENNNDSVSEGIAYGMLISVYMNDKALFDGLWTYWKANPATSDGPLMTWQIPGGSGTATDADEDAAFAMLMASRQWSGGTYAADATALMHAVLAHDMAAPYIKGGSNYAANGITNPSYFAPAWYRVFAAADTANATTWTSIANNVYTLLGNIGGTNANGLYGAWCGFNGSTPCAQRVQNTASTDTLYQYDSHRIPWRIGLDYCFNGTAAAQSYVAKTSAFFMGQGANGVGRIADLYDPSTSMAASGAAPNSSSLIGTAAVGAMSSATYKTFLDDAYQMVLDQASRGTLAPVDTAGRTPYSYFNATVGILTLLAMTGNMTVF